MSPKQVKEPFATFFAPASRANSEELARVIRKTIDDAKLSRLLEAVGSGLLVLNSERQIVALNSTALKTLAIDRERRAEVLGLRPGEALGCEKLPNTPNGCGTGKVCKTCGIGRALMDAQLTQRVVEYECLLSATQNGHPTSYEFFLRVAPFELETVPLLLLTIQDIGDRKRRENLERTFFHDLLNTLGALNGYRTLAEQGLLVSPENLAEMGALIERIVDEVRTHRALLYAEHESLTLKLETCSTVDIAKRLTTIFEHHEVRESRSLNIETCTESFTTDRTLLLRVLINMLKNAFEATPPNGEVSYRCEREGHSLLFAVHNPGRIPEEIAVRIFTRSFTTKQELGHGLGTYGMKLFGEYYLHGKVTFSTSDAEGTEFQLRLPIRANIPDENLTQLRLH
jgi:signal transduction histidine kinase